MTEKVITLVLVFLDSDDNEKSVVIKDPKADLTLETIKNAMEMIIATDALVSAGGKHLVSVGNCYYKTVTITAPKANGGE